MRRRSSSALQRLEVLGVTTLMTPAESARVSLDNLPAELEDGAGVTALRDALVLSSRLIDEMSTTDVRDWWGGTDPEVLVACAPRLPGAELFYTFGGRLMEDLFEQWNVLAVPAPDVEVVDPGALWPPVYSVVTNHPGFRDWTFGWGGQLIWWERTEAGFSIEQRTPLGTEVVELFRADQIVEAVRLAGRWIEPREGASGSQITVVEHRALEVVIKAAQEALDDSDLSREDRLQLEVLSNILLLQMRAPAPDRTIVGRALRGIANFTSGVLVGVAATYMTSLLVKFGVPLP